MDTWSVIIAFGVQTAIIAVLGMVKHLSEGYETSMEKLRGTTEKTMENVNKQLSECNEKVSRLQPYFSPNATIITANQFVEMLQSKKNYCDTMNILARELKIGCEFKIKDGVIDIEIRRENEK